MNKIKEIYNEMKTPLIPPILKARIMAEQYYKDFHSYDYKPIREHVSLMFKAIEENEINLLKAQKEYEEDLKNGHDVRLHEYTDQYDWDKLINNEYNDYIRARNIEQCDGFTICISPKAGTITYKELIELTMKAEKCPLIKSFFFYIEFYTNGSPEGNKPHIHLYGLPVKQTHKIRNSIRSYMVAMFKKYKPNINIQLTRKKDITYGREYIRAPESTPEKQALKNKDAEARLDLGIEDYYTYN